MKKALAAATLFCASLSAFAQPLPAPGQYFGLRSPSGKYLSATGTSEILGFAPHVAGWEQWQYVDTGGGHSHLQSFHGSVLAVPRTKSERPIHAAFYNSSGKDSDELANVRFIDFKGAQPGEVALVYYRSPSVRNYYALTEKPDGTVGIVDVYSTVIGGGCNPCPPLAPELRWKIAPVPSPAPGRQALKRGIWNATSLELRSAHGTQLMQGLVQKGSPNGNNFDMVHAPMPPKGGFQESVTISTSGNTRSAAYSVPIHYGETVYLSYPSGDGNYYLKSSGLKNPSGLYRVDTLWGGGGGTIAQRGWQIVDPTGRFKTGDRVARDVPIALRHATGLYLSVDPNMVSPQLAPHASGWETWTILPQR